MSLPIKFKCLIVDDEPPARDVLKRYIQQISMLELAGECANALQALTALKQQPIDLLFLDIQMPQLSGIEFIKTLKHAPRIILTTAFEHYAVQAFELDVMDYLVKPIQFDRFLKAVMKALPESHIPVADHAATHTGESASPAFLYFRADRKMVKVLLTDILYIESLKDYVKIYTPKGTLVTKYSMAALEAMLPASAFLRVHRSFMVALDKIDSFTPDKVEVNQNFVPIGKLYRQQVLRVLNFTNEN